MKRIIITIATLFFMSSFDVSSQEFSGYVSGGFSPLTYNLSQGARSGGLGGGFGAGYTYFFDVKSARMQWGIHSGLGLDFYNAQTKVDDGKTLSKNLIDDEGDAFELRSTLSGYNETQNALFLNIPVMAHLQMMDKYYVKAGVKAGVPLNGKYSAKDAEITSEGYYPKFDNTIDDAKYAGFGKFDLKDAKGNFELGFTVMFALETGMKFRISHKIALYTGVYFDYGLNNSLKKNHLSFVDYNLDDPENFTTNSVLTEYTDKVNVMAVGVKLSVAF